MSEYPILKTIRSPEDLKKLDPSLYGTLCDEIRCKLIETVSCTGGHLSSNLGTVELTVALHLAFCSPIDQIVWDVGHQSYTHKLLTGRFDQFDTIRCQNGLSGFPRKSESIHDAFLAGHSSTSISAAYGIAKAKTFTGKDGVTVAVIGDGALTGGMAYEALNNAGRCKDPLVIILNDNSMSISKNVGAMARYLAVIRSKPGYFRFKDHLENLLSHTPIIGEPIKNWLIASKVFFKKLLYPTTFFEDFGFMYMGPVDGHDITSMRRVFERAREIKKPVFIHVLTKKGKGYEYAEKNPGAYHGVSTFNIETGNPETVEGDSFSAEFGNYLTRLAKTDARICAITAAMKYGTGLQVFAAEFRSRLFDVGIAEQHAATFAAGLASGGMFPVFAVYSTFLQRSYDQLIHDIAIEKNKVLLAVDRAGIVGSDGETHQGVFDAAFLSQIPGFTVYSPSNYAELRLCMHKALYELSGPVAVRYPRGKENPLIASEISQNVDYQLTDSNRNVLLVTYGRLFAEILTAKQLLEEQHNIKISILKLVQITPILPGCLDMMMQYSAVYFVEEGIKAGGIAEQIAALLLEKGYKEKFRIRAIDNTFIAQGKDTECIRQCGFDGRSLADWIADGEKP